MSNAHDETDQPQPRTPLYGHTSEATAYVIPDYPYGYHLRCTKLVWLDENEPHGWRLMTRTSNPKVAGTEVVWNKPKASTYVKYAACMYVDSEGHVQWDGITAYSDGEDVERFVARYPGADMSRLRGWVRANIAYVRATLIGPANEDTERHRAELEVWERIEFPS